MHAVPRPFLHKKSSTDFGPQRLLEVLDLVRLSQRVCHFPRLPSHICLLRGGSSNGLTHFVEQPTLAFRL